MFKRCLLTIAGATAADIRLDAELRAFTYVFRILALGNVFTSRSTLLIASEVLLLLAGRQLFLYLCLYVLGGNL